MFALVPRLVPEQSEGPDSVHRMQTSGRDLALALEDARRWMAGLTRGEYTAEEVLGALIEATDDYLEDAREPPVTDELRTAVLAYIRKNRMSSLRRIAEDLSRRREIIAACLRELKRDGRIERRGDPQDPTGGWVESARLPRVSLGAVSVEEDAA